MIIAQNFHQVALVLTSGDRNSAWIERLYDFTNVLITISSTLMYIGISRSIQRVYRAQIKAEAFKTKGLTMKNSQVIYATNVFTDASWDHMGHSSLFQPDEVTALEESMFDSFDTI